MVSKVGPVWRGARKPPIRLSRHSTWWVSTTRHKDDIGRYGWTRGPRPNLTAPRCAYQYPHFFAQSICSLSSKLICMGSSCPINEILMLETLICVRQKYLYHFNLYTSLCKIEGSSHSAERFCSWRVIMEEEDSTWRYDYWWYVSCVSSWIFSRWSYGLSTKSIEGSIE